MDEELHKRAGAVRSLEERPNGKVLVWVRDKTTPTPGTPGMAPVGGVGGGVFSFEADKELGFEIGEDVTITVTRGDSVTEPA